MGWPSTHLRSLVLDVVPTVGIDSDGRLGPFSHPSPSLSHPTPGDTYKEVLSFKPPRQLGAKASKETAL